MSEPDRVRERYARREASGADSRWQDLEPSAWLMLQDKERAFVRWMRTCGLMPPADKRVLDVGRGGGGDLLTLVRLGFDPANLTGCELLEERAATARHRLPSSVRIEQGDALEEIELEPGSFDIVLQGTVFSSLLDPSFQERLAERMWELARPGGGILWFDFVYDNPRNPDVRGVKRSRVHELFPRGEMQSWRVVLAPPIARLVTRVHPTLYGVFNTIPLLRSHLLCWIRKPA